MKRTEFQQWLIQRSACIEAKNWFYASRQSPQKAWERCNRPCWMRWVIWVASSYSTSIHVVDEMKYHSPTDCAKNISRTECNEIRKQYPILEQVIKNAKSN